MKKTGSSCCGSLEGLSGRYVSRVNTVGPLDLEKLAAVVLLYVFYIAFPASLSRANVESRKSLTDSTWSGRFCTL